MQLRPARDADAAAVGRIWRDGWRDGHLGHVPPALVAVRTPESFLSRAAARVGDTVVAVATTDGGAEEVAGNTRARRFYERCGWPDAGPLDYAAKVPGRDTLPVPTHRYTKRLQADAS
jgi:hypothetical protein